MTPASRHPWGGKRDRAALVLRLAIVGYAVLVIGFRHVHSFPGSEPYEGPPTVAFWFVTAALTLLPLAYALWLTSRSLFGAALLLATFATFEVIAVHRSGVFSYEVDGFASHWPVQIAVRLVLLVALWGATLLFSRVDQDRGADARGRPDWRLVAAMLLAFVLPELEAFRATVLLFDDWNAGMLWSWILLGFGAMGTALAAWVLREKGLGLGSPSGGSGRAIGWAIPWALVIALLTILWSLTLHAWQAGTWLPRGMMVWWPESSLFLMVALVGPLLEEWTWRGVLWAALDERFGKFTTIAVTSTAFGLIHLAAGPVSMIPLTFVSGLLLGWLRARTGRLWPCVVAHALGNVVLISLIPTP